VYKSNSKWDTEHGYAPFVFSLRHNSLSYQVLPNNCSVVEVGENALYPELCRNESEVESKLIVQYLLPQLGYSPDNWYQEVAVGIRLDFLAFASQAIPFVLDANSLSVVMEAKHPNQNLNRHTCDSRAT